MCTLSAEEGILLSGNVLKAKKRRKRRIGERLYAPSKWWHWILLFLTMYILAFVFIWFFVAAFICLLVEAAVVALIVAIPIAAYHCLQARKERIQQNST